MENLVVTKLRCIFCTRYNIRHVSVGASCLPESARAASHQSIHQEEKNRAACPAQGLPVCATQSGTGIQLCNVCDEQSKETEKVNLNTSILLTTFSKLLGLDRSGY